MIILERHHVSGYEPRHYRREPDDVLSRRVDVDILDQLLKTIGVSTPCDRR